MLKKLHFRSARRKLLASFLLVLVLPFVAGAAGYAQLRQNMVADAQRSYVDRLNLVAADMNGLYGELDRLAGALKNTQWVEKIANMQGSNIDYSRTTVYDLSVYAAELANYQSLNHYIDRVMIAFPQKNLVMSMNGMVAEDTFFDNYYKAQGTQEDWWRTVLATYTDGATLQPMTVSNYGKTARMLTWVRTLNFSSVSQLPIAGQPPSAVLMISLVISGTKADGSSQYGLQDMLQAVCSEDGASGCILDDQNRVIASLQHRNSKFDGSYASLDTGAADVRTMHQGDMDFLSFRVTSPGDRWHYLAVVPQNVVLRPINSVMLTTALLLVLSMVVSLALAYVLFWSNYKPLKKLIERLPGNQGAKGEVQNEYSLIDQAFQHAAQQQSSLQGTLEFYYPMAVHSFFMGLLYDRAGSGTDQAAMQSLGIAAADGGWTAAVFFAEEGENGPAERPKAIRWSLEDRPVYIIEVDRNRYAILCNATDTQQLAAAARSLMGTLAGPEDRVIVGIGNPCAGIGQIAQSYREALSAVNFSFNSAEADPVVFYRCIEPDHNYGARIGQQEEDALKKLLRSGDTDALRTVLEPLIDSRMRLAGASAVSTQLFFYNLLSIALSAASGTDLPMSVLIDEQRIMTMKTARERKTYIVNVYIMVCAALRAERRGHAQRARLDILKFIDDNCLDDKLTLQSLSDLFGVTVPYLSKFIKDQTGNNFLDYVARKRIDMAKDMLRSGEYSVQQVGERVGYANALTFRRVFKKIEGVNPGDYRAGSGSK